MPNLYEFKAMLGPAERCPEGSIEWAERISNRLQLATESVTRHTVHHLKDCLLQIWNAPKHPWEIWPEGEPFGTPDDYCLAVTGHKWNVLIATVEEMTGEKFKTNGLTKIRMQTDLAKAQVKHRPQGARTDQLHYGVMKSKQGNTSAYLLRRLARDHSDILKRYEHGEFKSVRAAAKEAKIIKDLTPFEQIERLIKKLLPKLTDGERLELREML